MNIKHLIYKTRRVRYITSYLIGKYHLTKKKPIKIFSSFFFFPENLNPIELGRYFLGRYEKEERYLIDKYISPDDSIIELGGNVGVISNLINKKLSDKKKHIVFEPNPNLIKYLNINKKLNSAQYEIIEGIISKEPSNFYISDNILSSSIKVKTNNKIIPNNYSLYEILSNVSYNINTLIMDIEGAEIELIDDFSLLDFSKLIIEFHPNKTKHSEINKAKKTLKSSGFNLIEKKNDVEFWKSNKK